VRANDLGAFHRGRDAGGEHRALVGGGEGRLRAHTLATRWGEWVPTLAALVRDDKGGAELARDDK